MRNKIQQSKIQEINSLHGELEAIVKTGLDKAIRIGELLMECKEAIPHGQFSAWVDDNCMFTIRTAQNYMRIFSNRECIAGADSVATAYRLLKNETVSLLETHRDASAEFCKPGPPTFDEVHESLERYITAQIDEDLDQIQASDHCEKITLWMEYTAAGLDNSNVGAVRRFEEQLAWLQNKFSEGHLRAQRKLGQLLAEITH